MTVEERNLLLKKLEISVYGEEYECLYEKTHECRCVTCILLNFSLGVIARIVHDPNDVPEWHSCGKDESQCPKIRYGECKAHKKKNFCYSCPERRVPFLYEKNYLECASLVDTNVSLYGNKNSRKVHYAITALGHIIKKYPNISDDSKEEVVKQFLFFVGCKDPDYEVKSEKNRGRIQDLHHAFVNNMSFEALHRKIATDFSDLTYNHKLSKKGKQEDLDYIYFLGVLDNMLVEADESEETMQGLQFLLDCSTQLLDNKGDVNNI